MQRKTSVFIKQSLCLNKTGNLYMLDFTICIPYAVMSQPCCGSLGYAFICTCQNISMVPSICNIFFIINLQKCIIISRY